MVDHHCQIVSRTPIEHEGHAINIGWWLWDVEQAIKEKNRYIELSKAEVDLKTFGSSALRNNPDGSITHIPIQDIDGNTVTLSEPCDNVTITQRFNNAGE